MQIILKRLWLMIFGLCPIIRRDIVWQITRWPYGMEQDWALPGFAGRSPALRRPCPLASPQKCRDENARTRTEAHIFRGRLLLGRAGILFPHPRCGGDIGLSGYAQSQVPNPSYDIVCSGKTGAAETVRVLYNADQVDLQTLVRQFFRIINPYTADRQGNDVGKQYRPGIFYMDADDRRVIEGVVADLQKQSKGHLWLRWRNCKSFYPAEKYHQDYLKRILAATATLIFQSERSGSKTTGPQKYAKPSREELEARLSPIEYHVVREAGTEPPFTGKYWKHDEPGIYVDIASGEPLFSSSQKFDSGCGWPSFSKPLALLKPMRWWKSGICRTAWTGVEVRSRIADSSSWPCVAPDGPKALGGFALLHQQRGPALLCHTPKWTGKATASTRNL